METMKQLKDVKAHYEADDLEALTEYVKRVPVQLPTNQQYRIVQEGSVVHVYGTKSGIYNVNTTAPVAVNRGQESIDVAFGYKGIDRLVLHNWPYAAQTEPSGASGGQCSGGVDPSPSGASQPIAAKPSSSGESKRSGESRRRSSSGSGESHGHQSGGES